MRGILINIILAFTCNNSHSSRDRVLGSVARATMTNKHELTECIFIIVKHTAAAAAVCSITAVQHSLPAKFRVPLKPTTETVV